MHYNKLLLKRVQILCIHTLNPFCLSFFVRNNNGTRNRTKKKRKKQKLIKIKEEHRAIGTNVRNNEIKVRNKKEKVH